MALSVLNNIPSLVAQNQLEVTNNNLQNTLFQLSSGSRINSGADDPAGLSIINGLQANISALQQSSQNATDGVGQLQVADGALSQVTTLLNRAVTLATEAANGGLTSDQFAAVTNEYASITSEINRIGNATNFNGNSVFSSATTANPSQAVSTATSNLGVNSDLTAGTTTSVQLGNNPAYSYTAGASATTLLGTAGSLTSASTIANGKTISITNTGGTVNFTAATEKYTSSNAGLTAATALSAADAITVTNASGQTATYSFTAADKMQALLTALNANTGTNGISASLNGAGNLVIAGTPAAGNLTISTYTGTGVGGALTGTLNTVGDLMTQINTSGFGMTASLTAGGNFQVTSSNGAISATNNNATATLGTVAATNTIQDLINGINSSGLGVTAALASVSNPNQVRGATAVTGATAITAAQTLTLNSGAQAANGTYANSFTYTSTAGTAGSIADPIANTQGNNTVQGLIDAVNDSGTPFHAFLDAAGKIQFTDSSYSGNLSAAGTATAETGAFAEPAATSQLQITDAQNRGNLVVTNNDAVMGFVAPTNGKPMEGGNADSFVAPQMTGNSGASVFISDGEVTNPLYNTITIQVGLLSSTQIGTNATTLQTQNLGTATGAAAALTVINNSISDVAAMRGTIGAGINRLNSATNVINTQVQNLTSAQSSMQDANIGQVVANMSKYQVLEQTGISALAQANQNEQAVLKLLQ